MDGIKVDPISHGNTLSIYFQDPENNGLEVLWDTPWHVPQPQLQRWDLSMNKTEALTWLYDSFHKENGFIKIEDHLASRRSLLST